MCRWLAYTGEALRASTVILMRSISDVAQSGIRRSVKRPSTGRIRVWLVPEKNDPAEPALFHSIEPAWNDENLRKLTRASVRSPLFFSHVRAAAVPPIQQTNCHPFRHENWMFMHNGISPTSRR